MSAVITWVVWSVLPPECVEKVSCSSMLDAARAWADRQFRRGILPHNGHELLVCADSDYVRGGGSPAAGGGSMYRVRISIVNAPAFRASFAGVAFEEVNGDDRRG